MLLFILQSWALPNQQWFSQHPQSQVIIRQQPYDILSTSFLTEIQTIVPQSTLAFYGSQFQEQSKNCVDKYNLYHGKDFLIVPQHEIETQFLHSLFAVETIHCIPNHNPQDVRQRYNSMEFRKEVMPGVHSFTPPKRD
jgi:hypothetical protein